MIKFETLFEKEYKVGTIPAVITILFKDGTYKKINYVSKVELMDTTHKSEFRVHFGGKQFVTDYIQIKEYIIS